MEVKRDARVLHHISEYCNEISETVERFGDSFGTFAADAIYRNGQFCVPSRFTHRSAT